MNLVTVVVAFTCMVSTPADHDHRFARCRGASRLLLLPRASATGYDVFSFEKFAAIIHPAVSHKRISAMFTRPRPAAIAMSRISLARTETAIYCILSNKDIGTTTYIIHFANKLTCCVCVRVDRGRLMSLPPAAPTAAPRTFALQLQQMSPSTPL